MISVFTFVKLATSDARRLSYSLGSMMRVSVVCILVKKVDSTVPASRTYSTLWLVFLNK